MSRSLPNWFPSELKSKLFAARKRLKCLQEADEFRDSQVKFHRKKRDVHVSDVWGLAWCETAFRFPSGDPEIDDQCKAIHEEWLSCQKSAPSSPPPPKSQKPEEVKKPPAGSGKKLEGWIEMGRSYDPTDPLHLTLGTSDKDIAWVYHNMTNPAADESNAPSAGAWGLLQYARAYPKDFYDKHVPKAMAKAGPASPEDEREVCEDDIAALEAVLDEINMAIEAQAVPDLDAEEELPEDDAAM